MNELYELKDIKPQLSEKQIEKMQHYIFMAEELDEPQKVKLGEFGASFIIWPSGMLQIFEGVKAVGL